MPASAIIGKRSAEREPRRGLAVEIVDEDQRAGGDDEADDLAGRGQGREDERRVREFRHHPADDDLQADHRRDRGEHAP